MELFMLWLSFLGSWLLFAGSIYQAALELKDEDIEFDRIRAVANKVDRPQPVSMWWWLLPPVKIHLERQQKKTYQTRYLKALSHTDIEALIVFRSKAAAWSFVAIGGLCLAINETYQLSVHQKWNKLILITLILLMIMLSIINLITSIKRSSKIVNL